MNKVAKYIILILTVLFVSGCSSTTIDKKEKISRYFVMGEAVNSSIAKRRKIPNIPNGYEKMSIKYSAMRLDEVRRILGRPLVVTSWYRSRALNKVVGGSSTSAHRSGLAIDVMLKKGKAGKREFEKVKKKMSSYDQLIYYPYRGHLHVGFRKNRFDERQQTMMIR